RLKACPDTSNTGEGARATSAVAYEQCSISMETTSQTGQKSIPQLIINSPYEEPKEHWKYHRETRLFTLEKERRQAGYIRESEKVGIQVPSDGGEFLRLCCKMATGSGKTILMAMLIAWQALNKNTYPQDSRFAKHFLIVAPGLTVKKRLQVLLPGSDGNYYE